MKITYIGHSGFMAELEEKVFLFDYYKGDIPKVPGGKQLIVFVSHNHHDHFSHEIFRLNELYPDVKYVLSKDIKFTEKFMIRHHIPTELKDRIVWTAARETYTTDGITIETLRSTDAGVAFLVQYGDVSIYHAGDLNWWYWEGEPEDWNPKMARDFKDEIRRIENRSFDVAFLPLDPRQDEQFYLGFDYFMKNTDTKTVFPMHCWGDYSVIRKLKEMPCSADYRDRIQDIDREGQTFSVDI